MHACNLLQDRDIDAIVDKLQHLTNQTRRMIMVNGRPYWKPSIGHAIRAGDTLHRLYTNIATRRQSVESISKRESLEVDESTHVTHVLRRQPPSSRSRLKEEMCSARTLRYLAKFTSMLASKGRSVRLVSKNSWIDRIRSVTLEGRSSAEFKSINLVEYLTAELCTRWVYCRHVSVLLQLFQFGLAYRSDYGTYRIELLVNLFDRIVDLHNFQLVLMHLTSHEHATLTLRIGTYTVTFEYFNAPNYS
jgi:hypothetical protein